MAPPSTKRIAKIEVVAAGSNPDVDSDFHTNVKAKAVEHVADMYGSDNISSIITFTSLGAKNAFKTMCTIYQIPFATANKISSLIPPAIEGVAPTIGDLFDPNRERYPEAAEFREAVSGDEWSTVVAGMKAVEGRIKSTGIHPCGIIISGKPLHDTIPLQTTKEGVVSTQWTYPECEDMGLIKFDFLALDTVDIVQQSVENIVASGKTPPNMLDIIHGSMDDKKVFELFSAGHTIGVFQFGSDLVREYIKLLKPTEFEDLVVTTASCRPGPMGMDSHINYANRKNSGESNKVVPIHEDFVGSPLEGILEKTQNLIVFQEQILKIANEIADMTLQEGDKLRKAMGKKQKSVMDSMKIKFASGATQRGYSTEAIDLLWDTIAKFASYGFNRAHAVAYAMLSYQVAYLKVYYPVEFMAALINQHSDDKDKTRSYLKEARRMGIKVGTVDINASQTTVSPDFDNKTPHDILFGVGSINSVSASTAEIIVDERTRNGDYKSMQDLVSRCEPLGVNNKTIYESLAHAGALDCFGFSRRAIAENIPSLIKTSKTKTARGDSLFDLFEEDNPQSSEDFVQIDFSQPEYPLVEKLQKEATTVGLYLTGHPLENLGAGLSFGNVQTIASLKKSQRRTTARIVGSITDVTRTTSKKGAVSLSLTIDDGKDYLSARASREVSQGIAKRSAQEKIKQAYCTRSGNITPEVIRAATNTSVQATDDVLENSVYIMDVMYAPATQNFPERAEVQSIQELKLASDGKLPVRVRMVSDSPQESLQKIENLLQRMETKFGGEYPVHIAVCTPEDAQTVAEEDYYKLLAKQVVVDQKKRQQQSAEESASARKRGGKAPSGAAPRKIPAPAEILPADIVNASSPQEEHILAESLSYIESSARLQKNSTVEQILSKNFGAERVDFGVYNETMK